MIGKPINPLGPPRSMWKSFPVAANFKYKTRKCHVWPHRTIARPLPLPLSLSLAHTTKVKALCLSRSRIVLVSICVGVVRDRLDENIIGRVISRHIFGFSAHLSVAYGIFRGTGSVKNLFFPASMFNGIFDKQ